jgi:hypothetical protein
LGNNVLEKDIEAKGSKFAKERGLEHYKFTSPNRRSVPDRLVLGYILPEHRAIVSQYVRFIEYKKPGGVLTTGQARELGRLTELGFKADVADSVELVEKFMKGMNGAKAK